MGEFFSKDSESCVSFNVFANCEDKKYSEKKDYENFDKNGDSCVEINVYPKCGKDFRDKYEEDKKDDKFEKDACFHKEDKEYKRKKDSCVKINIFADCNKKDRPCC